MLETESKQLISLFATRTQLHRPYVTLKWAQSADGKVAGAGGRPVQISGPESRSAVHELRSRCDGILVGVGTILADNPLLNSRHAAVPRHPARFVLDSDLRTPANAAMIRDASAPTTVLHRAINAPDFADRRSALGSAGGQLIEIPADASGRLSLPDALRQIAAAGSFDLLVEAGPTLAKSFFAAGLADRVWVFTSLERIDDPTAPTAAPVPQGYIAVGTIRVGDDELTEYLNPQSDAFFGPHASADFVLLADAHAPLA